MHRPGGKKAENSRKILNKILRFLRSVEALEKTSQIRDKEAREL